MNKFVRVYPINWYLKTKLHYLISRVFEFVLLQSKKREGMWDKRIKVTDKNVNVFGFPICVSEIGKEILRQNCRKGEKKEEELNTSKELEREKRIIPLSASKSRFFMVNPGRVNKKQRGKNEETEVTRREWARNRRRSKGLAGKWDSITFCPSCFVDDYFSHLFEKITMKPPNKAFVN